jgi:hypothetical protein
MYQPGYGAPPPEYHQLAADPLPAEYPAVPPTPVATPAVDDTTTRLALLKQLGELKAQGVLTDAEFDAQKRKILAD